MADFKYDPDEIVRFNDQNMSTPSRFLNQKRPAAIFDGTELVEGSNVSAKGVVPDAFPLILLA